MMLGAGVEGHGVRFAAFSGIADAIELCLFDEAGAETRQPLEPGDGPWSVELDTADPGSRRVVADTVELTGRSLALLAVTAGRD